MSKSLLRMVMAAGALATLTISAAVAAPAAKDSGDAATAVGAADAFAQVKRLAGKWRGTTERGEAIDFSYQVAAHGSTVIETQSPGEADEMLTVFSIDGHDMVLTHYCPMGPVGNQPHLALDRANSTAGELRFRFISLTNLDAAKDVHLHAGSLKVIDDQHIERRWEVYKDGHRVGLQVFKLTRM